MTDPVKSFEFVLKKHCKKRSKSLYINNKQQNKPTFTPQDVISSVSLQLKAIKVADSYKINKSTHKDINKYKSSTYLSVNTLPTYEERPKQSTKFDTQCVTDTQLINVIEDAEIIDRCQGMTDAFETPFSQINTVKQDQVDEKSDMDKYIKSTNDLKDTAKNAVDLKGYLGQVPANVKQSDIKYRFGDRDSISKHSDGEIIDPKNMYQNNITALHHQVNDNEDMVLDRDVVNNIIIIDKDVNTTPIENTQDKGIPDEQLSQILNGKTLSDKFKSNRAANVKLKHTVEVENCTQIEEYSQILNQCQEIELDDNTDIVMPPSLIFPNNNMKTKSKSPSPLVFNLDKFEHFENIAVSLLEFNDFNTAKHVVNSQILDKELHIKIDEEIKLNERDYSSPIVPETKIEERNIGSPIIERHKELIQIDKATSEEILNQLTNQRSENNANVNMGHSIDVFEDEILFSSDEEKDDVHKELQDLPFTCALETSFYDQSDVLDKTMYVGFQTASNRSIQIGTYSFAKAQSFLSDVTYDEITVTDMVKDCDNSFKDTSNAEQIKLSANVKERQFNPADQEAESSKKMIHTEDTVSKFQVKQKTNKEVPKESNLKNSTTNHNFMGFTTANNKKINLSETALARCKKVFQDIDLSQNFDFAERKENLPVDIIHCDKNVQKSITSGGNNVENTQENKNPLDDVLQGIDDVIIEEFGNIEMSLKDDKPPVKDIHTIGLKNTSNKDVDIYNKDGFKDVIFEENMIEDNSAVNKNLNTHDTFLSQIISNPNLKDGAKINIGFKTASHKNIKISEDAWAKSKKVFEDIGGTESSNQLVKKVDVVNIKVPDFDQITTFVGFKTANNKDIQISVDALAKTKTIFKDIDAKHTEFESDIVKLPYKEEYKATTCVQNIDQPSTSEGFAGFKTANNKNINISESAWCKSKIIFNDIDSTDLPKITNKGYPEINPIEDSKIVKADHNSIENQYIGFKTAHNRNIQISKEALAKTKNIFNDINSSDFVFPKTMNNQKTVTYNEKVIDIENKTSKQSNIDCMGLKPVNNKLIKVSVDTSVPSRNIFKQIDYMESKFSAALLEEDKQKEEIKAKKVTKSVARDTLHQSLGEPKFVGFTTANNKCIKISREALAKAENILKDIDAKDLNVPGEKQTDYPDFVNHQETTENKAYYSKIIHSHTNNKEAVHIAAKSEGVPQFQGFKTASNKQVEVSTEALIKTKNIFKDIHSTDFKIPEKNQKGYPDLGANLKITEANQSPRHNKALQSHTRNSEEDCKNTQEVTSFQGFNTASNKQVKVSKESLIKSKNIFKDIGHNKDDDVTDKMTKVMKLHPEEFSNNYNKVEDIPVIPVFKGFQTANKKPVVVSAKALEKSKKLFEDLKIDNSGFSGFQTASNKLVKISEQALTKSRNIFKEIESSGNNNAQLKKLKCKGLYPEEIYQHEKKIDDDDLNSTFTGFQTGNNERVQVSNIALTETNTLFDMDRRSSFKGFETASNKKVTVSKEAIAKSKKIFQDVDTATDILEATDLHSASNFNIAFQTGNSKPVPVSKEALARSKRLFIEIGDGKSLITIKKDKKEAPTIIHENDAIHSIIDTQVINHFEESLHTEDFHETPIKSKRSGSPILSCPRAKKRKKFETPYNVRNVLAPITKPIEIAKDENKFIFREDYKKNKKYTLKYFQEITTDDASAVDPYLLIFDYDSLLQFEFKQERNEISSGNMTIDLLKVQFLNSVNSKLVPNGWLENHLKLILWKIISYEIKFKCLMCTVRNVIDQLKYRYDRELYNAQRPALRKIYEKDDVPSKTLVLCVVGIYVDGVRVPSVTECTSNVELLLTDGWYCIQCVTDKMLSQLVCSGKIPVGSKIVTSGAELTGCEQGVAPWEDTSGVRLKIFGNSTRRARWDARLGYHGNGAILSPLSSVNVLGGKVAKLRVFIARVYPALYVEKFEDGSTVTRSERLENLHQIKMEAERQAIMEKIYEEVEMEFADKESQDSVGLSDNSSSTCMDSGSQISKIMKKSKDPDEFRAELTESQSRLLEAHTSRYRDRLLQDIQARVRERVEKAGVCVNRNVVSLLKIRVAGVTVKGDKVDVCKGMMSIWKPNDGIREIVREGAWIDVLNVVPTAVRYSEIQISAGRQSIFSTSKYKPPEKLQPYINLLQRKCYSIRDLAQNPTMSTDYNEIDTIGLIFLIDPPLEQFDSTKQSFQNVYLTDADKNIICANFWGGLKKFGFQNVLDTGQAVACVNLQKRAGNTRRTIPQYRVTELSYFTQTPKSERARKLLLELNKKIAGLDRRKFCEECIVLKNNYLLMKHNNENVSPYRFMNHSDINMSKNKMFVDSPLARNNKIDDNFNLTGLDFESTFRQDTELSEEALKRKRKVNEKIARLKMYGEPPPLSPLHIINRSKQATSSYKSPLLPNNNSSNMITRNSNQKCFNENSHLKANDSDSSINVTNVNNTPQKCGETDCEVSYSPILLNRTYVKSVNPVKINFDVKDSNDSNIDHFADEFDGSPPLSLD